MSDKISLGFLVILLISSGIYITMPEAGLKMRIDFDKSTFYSQNANNRWVVAGREYNYMFDGASKMYRSKARIVMDPQLDIEKNTTTVIRTTPYIRAQ